MKRLNGRKKTLENKIKEWQSSKLTLEKELEAESSKGESKDKETTTTTTTTTTETTTGTGTTKKETGTTTAQKPTGNEVKNPSSQDKAQYELNTDKSTVEVPTKPGGTTTHGINNPSRGQISGGETPSAIDEGRPQPYESPSKDKSTTIESPRGDIKANIEIRGPNYNSNTTANTVKNEKSGNVYVPVQKEEYKGKRVTIKK